MKPLSRLLLLLILMTGLCSPVLVYCSEKDGVYAPSAPEFTVELVDSSYYVPPTYEVDQYSGETVIDEYGYTVENKSLVVTIRNQPIKYTSSYTGTKYYMAYNVAVKGHFGDEWDERYFSDRRTFTMGILRLGEFPFASNSDYTVLCYGANHYPDNSQLDVRVQALIGYESEVLTAELPGIVYYTDGIAFYIDGEWSEMQTITINVLTSEVSCSVVPILETDQLNFLVIIGALILIPTAVGLGILIRRNKRKRSS